jgi:hypothetical protein
MHETDGSQIKQSVASKSQLPTHHTNKYKKSVLPTFDTNNAAQRKTNDPAIRRGRAPPSRLG